MSDKTVGDYFSKHHAEVVPVGQVPGWFVRVEHGTPLGEREIPYGLLPDWAIKRYIPIFNADGSEVDWNLKQDGVISYGLSSAGYDPRLGRGFVGYKQVPFIDPKKVSESDLKTAVVDGILCLDPGECILAHTEEIFHIPDDVIVLCANKSTYARVFLQVATTIMEPGWHGQVTLEIKNTLDVPVVIYPGEGICQFLFHRIARPDETYASRNGKYQGQRGVVPPKVK